MPVPLGSGIVDVGSFARNIVTHIRGILLCALAIGLIAMTVGLLTPAKYTAESVIRVIPPKGQESIDPTALATAVDWYVALANAPSVAQTASAGQPSLSPEEVQERTRLALGNGPGEVVVLATSPDKAASVSLSNTMANAFVSVVSQDEALQIGQTRLTVLLPAQLASRAGPGPLTLFLSGFLLSFVLVATAAGILHPHLNWRLSRRLLASMEDETGITVITDRAELAAFLAFKGRETAQVWLATDAGVPSDFWADLQERIHGLGANLTVLAPDGARDDPARPAVVYLPDPNDGSAATLAAAAATGAFAVMVCPAGQRARGLRRYIHQLPQYGLRPLVLTTAGGG